MRELAVHSKSHTRTKRAKLLPKPGTRDAFEAELMQKVVRYAGSKFLGRGKYLKFEAETEEGVMKLASSSGVKGPWMLYAICLFHGVEHSVHLRNF